MGSRGYLTKFVTARDVERGFVGDPPRKRREDDALGHKAEYRIAFLLSGAKRRHATLRDMCGTFAADVVEVRDEGGKKFLMGCRTGTLFTARGRCLSSRKLRVVI